ncbi:MAG: thermosome subunit [Euryarchaeota archaeon]|nr:thermosome subunit [Euryarchaeota archaeon]
MATMGGQPVLILKEGTQRTRGSEARRTNIMVARIIAETLRTTLGPRGMDKMLVDSLGDITITNDGVTILKEMDIEHPVGKMIVEVAKTQESEVGDGTTTAVVLAGELLKQAEELLDQEVHATIIARGYRLAAEKAREILNEMAHEISPEDEEMLRKVAVMAMTGKGAEKAKEHLAEIVVEAVQRVREGNEVDRDLIKIEKKAGGGIEDTELINGIVIDKERVHPGMPRSVKDARIALIKSALEVRKTEVDAKINITDPNQLQAFIDEEERMLRSMVEKIKASGANVVLCQKGIDDLAQHYLAKEGIFAVRRVKQSDMKKLARATGARVVTSLDDLSEKDLGYAGIVEEVKIGDDEMVFVRECRDPKSVTILIRGGSEHVVNEAERAIEDAIGVVAAALRCGKVVAGAGAPEVEVARKLREYAVTVGGREQLAIEAFADAVEAIPRALAENAGLDPIDVLVELRKAHEESPDYGYDVITSELKDTFSAGLITPVNVKTQAISSASEVAVMILRIDDIIAAGKLEKEEEGEKPEMPSMPEF